jgi:hypothetical protein
VAPIKTLSLGRVDLSVEHSEVDEQGVVKEESAAEKSEALFFGTHASGVQLTASHIARRRRAYLKPRFGISIPAQ